MNFEKALNIVRLMMDGGIALELAVQNVPADEGILLRHGRASGGGDGRVRAGARS